MNVPMLGASLCSCFICLGTVRRLSGLAVMFLLGLSLLPGVVGVAQAQDLALNAPTSSSASERDSGHTDHTFQVTLTQSVAGNVGYMLCFSSASGGENYATRNDDFRVIKGGVVQNGRPTCHQSVIRAGQTNTATGDLIGIRVLGDTRVEPDEKVDVELKPLIYLGDGSNYGDNVPYDYTDRSQMKYGVRLTAANARQSFTIVNDDRPRVITPQPRKTFYHHSIVVYSDSGSEDTNERRTSTTRREIRVQLVKNPKYNIQGQVQFKVCLYSGRRGTATRDTGGGWDPGEDYRLLVGGSIVNGQCRTGGTFDTDGFSSPKIEIDVRKDADIEPDETVVFTVELLSEEHQKVIQVHNGTYTIRNDDFGVTDPEVTIDSTGGAVDEGGFADFRVKIATPPGGSSVRRINVAARVPWTNEVWSNTIITAGPDAWFRVPTYGVTGDYHLCAWVRPGRDYTIGGTSGNAPPTSTDNRRTLTDDNGNPVHNPAYGTLFNVNDGKASSCPSGHTVLVRDTGGAFQMGMDESQAVQVPSTAVTNLQVAAVDGNTAKATWDAVPHATGYRVEFESTSALAYQGNYIQKGSNGHTGTSWTFDHDAAEPMTLTVTVTPEFREDGNVQQFHALAGTATIEVGPGSGTQQSALGQDSVGTAVCDTASLKSDIAGYIGEQADGTPHVTRWKRVLAAFGDDNGYTTMTAAEAQTYADRGWTRWDPVVEALECLENAGGVNPEPQPDPDPEPGITVTGGGGIAEGGDAVFTVHSNPAPSSDLAVTVNVDDDAAGDFLAQGNEGTRTVTILAGRTSATLTLATENDSTDEPDGSVSVTALDGTGYTVDNPGTAAVSVADDDDPPVATPVVGIAGDGGIAEGGAASFTLTANPAPQGEITVTVDVTDSGSFAAGGQAGTRTVTVGASGTATFTVTTTDDTADEADGSITAMLQAGTGYTVEDSPDDTASVAVSDNDDPVIGISGGNGVTEGAPAAFTLTATPAPHAALTVSLAVTQSGDYAASGQTGTREVVIPTEGSVTLEVATVNDSADEPDGSVTATLAAGSGYMVAASPDDAASVSVADDDVAAAGVPTLSVNDVEVKEGPYRRVTFTVTLSQASDRYVSFSYRVRESNPVSAKRNVDFWASAGKIFAGMRPGQTEYKIMAGMVIDDSHDEDPETFELVLSDAHDAVLADAVGVATIVNSDPMPQAWLGRLGRTLAQQALDGITGRLTAPRTPGAHGTLAGQAFSLRPGGPTESASDPTTPAPSTVERLAALVLPGLTAGGAGGTGANPAFGGADPLFGGGLGDGDAGAPGFRGPGGLTPQSLNLRDLLLGSSFTATGQPDAWGGSVALWGRAALATFDGQEDTFALDGEVLTGLLGVDYARDRWLLGVSLLQSASTGGYLDRNTGATPCPAHDLSAEMRSLVCDGAVRAGDGKVEATLTAAVPYAAFQASERLNLWGAAGYGAGEVTLTPETGDALKTDLDWTMAQMGVRGTVLAPVTDDAGLAGGPTLAVTSDALWARTTSEKIQDGLAASESDVTRLRLGLEGSWLMALEDLGQVTPKLAVGARHDGGDAETGFGVELGGGLAWAMPTAGLALNVEGRTLLTHREEAFQDQGLAASLVFDPDPATPRGPSLTLRQDWGGQATGGVEALFAANPLVQRQSTTATRRWAADMAWGFPAWDGAFTSSPLVGLGLAPGSRDYRLGWRLVPATAASAFALEVQATRREPDAAMPEHRLGLELSTRW